MLRSTEPPSTDLTPPERDTMVMRYADITSERASEPQNVADTDENEASVLRQGETGVVGIGVEWTLYNRQRITLGSRTGRFSSAASWLLNTFLCMDPPPPVTLFFSTVLVSGPTARLGGVFSRRNDMVIIFGTFAPDIIVCTLLDRYRRGIGSALRAAVVDYPRPSG